MQKMQRYNMQRTAVQRNLYAQYAALSSICRDICMHNMQRYNMQRTAVQRYAQYVALLYAHYAALLYAQCAALQHAAHYCAALCTICSAAQSIRSARSNMQRTLKCAARV